MTTTIGTRVEALQQTTFEAEGFDFAVTHYERTDHFRIRDLNSTTAALSMDRAELERLRKMIDHVLLVSGPDPFAAATYQCGTEMVGAVCPKCDD